MAEIKRRCMGCMHEIDDVRVCPYCGYDDDTPYSSSFLRPKTVLRDRYLVGKALWSNGEGVTYIAYDLIIDSVVELREYFPDQLSERRAEDGEITIVPGCEAQFKALLSDFHELYSSLQKMRTLTALCNVYDIFEANQSLYAVLEHVQGVSLNRFIQDNAGQLEWSRVAELILPLLKSIGAMHGQQMIHRGISPDTIRVTKKAELKLCGFCISSARNVKSEISPELFSGYTAPEQYSANVLQGTWTDVYAVAAVMYKMLTGTMPTDAAMRLRNDNLLPVHVLNSSVPAAVSTAIMRCLNLSVEDRTRTVYTLIDVVSANFSDVELQIEEKKEPEKKKKRYGLYTLLISLGILAVVGTIVVIFALSGNGSETSESSLSDSSFDSSAISDSSLDSSDSSSSGSSSSSSSSESQVTLYAVPKLVDQMYASVQNNSQYQELFTFEVIEEYNAAVPTIGRIFEQTPAFNETVEKGSVIQIKVSKGSPTPVVPAYQGLTKDQYLLRLGDLGITCNIVFEDSDQVPSGYVISTDRQPGSTINIEAGEMLTIHVAI